MINAEILYIGLTPTHYTDNFYIQLFRHNLPYSLNHPCFSVSLPFQIIINVLFCFINIYVLLVAEVSIILLVHVVLSLLVTHTTHNSCILYRYIVFVHVLYITFRIIYIHTYRNHIHHVCDCATLPLCQLWYILYPPPHPFISLQCFHNDILTHHLVN